MDIGNVYFYGGKAHCGNGVAQGVAVVRVRPGVDDHTRGLPQAVYIKLVDKVHQGAFVVGLEAGGGNAFLRGVGGGGSFQVGKGAVAVNGGFSGAQQV